MRRLAHLAPAVLSGGLIARGLHPDLPGWPCPLRQLTGIPCPTCFLTRATAAALTGRLADSVRLHAFGPAVAAGLLVWSVLAIRQGRLLPTLPRRDGRLGAGDQLSVAAAMALLVYWAVRLGLQHWLGWRTFPPS